MLRISCLLASVLLFGAALSKPVERGVGDRGYIVFLGDSITDAFDSDGIDTWNKFYAPLGAVDTGVSGDRTTNIIDRINGGMIDNLNAHVAVLKIGTNDLAGGVDEQTVYRNIGTILDMIKSKNPGVRILLLGILPRTGADIHQKIKNTNALIANYYNNDDVFYMDMGTRFSPDLGEVYPELFTDGLHLTKAGYEAWAETMNPLFDLIVAMP